MSLISLLFYISFLLTFLILANLPSLFSKSFYMNNSLNSSLIFVVPVIVFLFVIFGGLIYWKFFYRKTDNAWKETVRIKLFELESSNKSMVEKLLGLDKLLEYSYQNKFGLFKTSLGAILKQKQKVISRGDLNIIWSAHKLRNHIAHNIHFTPNERELTQAINSLSVVIKKLLV